MARKRVGRGIGSGHGKTSGRGHKGQKARSGGGVRPGFEGGQNPLYRRLPKRGFTNIHRKEYAIVNLEHLNRFEAGTEVTPEMLMECRRGQKSERRYQDPGRTANLKVKLTVKANKFSAIRGGENSSCRRKNRGDLMFKTISNILKVADLRNKILFTLGILIVFRIGSFIPVPEHQYRCAERSGPSTRKRHFRAAEHVLRAARCSTSPSLPWGSCPYITASIIVQLLSMDVIPKFARMGEGRRGGTAQTGAVHALWHGRARFDPGIRDVDRL